MSLSILTDNAQPITKQIKKPKNHLFFALNEDVAIYGRPITGVVTLVVREEIRIKNISIRWEGKEYTSWYTGASLNEQQKDERVIFSKVAPVFDNSQGEVLKVGETRTWNFSWELPLNCPTSYTDPVADQTNATNTTSVGKVLSNFTIPTGGILPKGFFGKPSSISYQATVIVEEYTDSTTTDNNTNNASSPTVSPVINRNNNNNNNNNRQLTSTIKFLVAQRFDPEVLKLDPIIKQNSRSHILHFMPIEVKATLFNGGVCFRGGYLPVKVEVLNGSSRRIETITVSIYANTVLNAQGQVLQRRNVIVSGQVAGGSIEPKGFYVQTLAIDVPPIVSPSISLGVLIQRHYELVIDVSVPLGLTSLSLSFPVLVFEPSELDLEHIQSLMKFHTVAAAPSSTSSSSSAVRSIPSPTVARKSQSIVPATEQQPIQQQQQQPSASQTVATSSGVEEKASTVDTTPAIPASVADHNTLVDTTETVTASDETKPTTQNADPSFI